MTSIIAQSNKNTQYNEKGDFLIVRTYEVIRGSAAKSVISISDGKNKLRTSNLKLRKLREKILKLLLGL